MLDGDKLSRLAAFVENPSGGWMLGERRLAPGLYDRDERAQMAHPESAGNRESERERAHPLDELRIAPLPGHR